MTYVLFKSINAQFATLFCLKFSFIPYFIRTWSLLQLIILLGITFFIECDKENMLIFASRHTHTQPPAKRQQHNRISCILMNNETANHKQREVTNGNYIFSNFAWIELDGIVFHFNPNSVWSSIKFLYAHYFCVCFALSIFLSLLSFCRLK